MQSLGYKATRRRAHNELLNFRRYIAKTQPAIHAMLFRSSSLQSAPLSLGAVLLIVPPRSKTTKRRAK